MAGGWNTGLQFGNAQSVGAYLTITGPYDTPGASTAFTKGTWTQLIAATTADTAWVCVQCSGIDGGGWAFAYDIGIGPAGSEVAIVQNLVSQAYIVNCTTLMFPLAIPAGSRVSVRCASNTTYDTGAIQLTCFDNTALSAGVGSAVDTYGFQAGSNVGVAVDPGATANTKGAYAQIAASIANDLAGFFLCFDSQALASGSNVSTPTLVDIAIGAAGSEKVILPNFSLIGNTSTPYRTPDASPYFPIPIRAGTRVAARAQSRANGSPDRLLGVTFYGVRL